MAERVEMSFKNPEVKMWFLIMVPVVIFGSIAIFWSDPIAKFVPIFLFVGGYATYYIWRFRYRRKKKANAGK